jgi:hypothetical protein
MRPGAAGLAQPLIRALAAEPHEHWLEAARYLNMEHLREHKEGGAASGRLSLLGPWPRKASAVLAPSRPRRLRR